MTNVRKRISELTALTSASLDTVIVGVDNGITYKIELDTLADAVTSRVNTLDRERLQYLESVTSSFETKGRSVISSSAQITTLGFISTSVDISALNSFTSSQNILNTTFTNGITGRLTTSSFNDFSSSVNQRILDATNEQSFNGLISGSSQLTSSYDSRYVLSGSITQTTWDNIANKPNGIVSQSTDLSSLNSFTASQSSLNIAFTNGVSARLQTSSFNEYTASQSTSSLVNRLNAIENVSGSWITESETGSFLTSLNGAISSSSQLTSSYDIRYTLSGSVQPLPSNLISSSAQITTFGFISSSTTINTGSFATTSSLSTLSSSVDSRLDTLEATIISGSPNYTQVLGNRRTSITTIGVSIISGSITTIGNPVQIMVTGDANPITTAWCRLQIFRDGSGIGNIIQVENSSNLNVPYCLNVIDTPPAGTYTYSMRTVDTMSGTFDFGEFNGPLLTAVELKTNTNLPSTNNTFTGTNRFNGGVTIGPGAGFEGGELALAYAPSGSTLTGSAVSVDIYQDRLRIFEGGGNSRGVHIDLSKAPIGVAGELIWKVSGMVAAGTFVSLDNLKCTITTSGYRGLNISAVSTTFEADVSGVYSVPGASGGGSANNITYTTTSAGSAFSWNFPTHGDTAIYQIRDKTNNRFYRVTMMIGASYISNFISIERLF
jgi:hypothetical protein